jgi:hypothetical protein
MERTELANYRPRMLHDVRQLVEKYRAVFGWDIPEVDEAAADRLILSGIQEALDKVAKDITQTPPGGSTTP